MNTAAFSSVHGPLTSLRLQDGFFYSYYNVCSAFSAERCRLASLPPPQVLEVMLARSAQEAYTEDVLPNFFYSNPHSSTCSDYKIVNGCNQWVLTADASLQLSGSRRRCSIMNLAYWTFVNRRSNISTRTKCSRCSAYLVHSELSLPSARNDATTFATSSTAYTPPRLRTLGMIVCDHMLLMGSNRGMTNAVSSLPNTLRSENSLTNLRDALSAKHRSRKPRRRPKQDLLLRETCSAASNAKRQVQCLHLSCAEL
jgi:Tfp pilus assembly protein PilV